MKIDKGFSFSYWKLSYRRKLVRTIWMIPITIIVSVIVCFTDISAFYKVSYILFILLVEMIQLFYNYKKYQKERVENKSSVK